MAKIQEVFDRIEKVKKEQREIKKAYRDALDNSQEHQELTEKMKELRDKKKQIEEEMKQDFSAEFTRLEDLKIDLETDKEMMSDLAFNTLLKGEKIEVKDQYENEYEPIFNVKFKKIG